ncbi:carbamate kinase [Streptomyces mangrovisoli]|uniref:Carbamate kinase n=1 Tax=Streptomyces mangrovisoli TaxID=1428628 RepID=A0A1J4P280_9ACTN|nr:carbamate kinase [Streptomyces mangrovisoli]OIJ68680.1 carbamate kinase [Streptomyces mangrovisoli]
MRIVIALGGNALLRRGERPEAAALRANAVRVATSLAPLAHDHQLVITYGDGPEAAAVSWQVGEAAAVPWQAGEGGAAADGGAGVVGDPALGRLPLDLLAARSQGMIGSLLAGAFRDALPDREVAALVTHTRVRADDPAFERPGTPVGPVLPRRTALTLAARHGWRMARAGADGPEGVDGPGGADRPALRGGWRRMVAAPEPQWIEEAATVRALLGLGTLVLCGGGGGVPVAAGPTGLTRPVEAVVDKDLAAARLAEDIVADFLLILTDVPNVYAGYGTPERRPVLDATPAQLRRAHLPEGSMGPKAEAAARFVERTGALAAIGALDAADAIVHGRSGTLVHPGLPVV